MSNYLSKGQVNDLFDKVIIPDMRNRTAAIEQTKQQLIKDIRGSVPGAGPATRKVWNEKTQDFDTVSTAGGKK
jgi:hypothetical protein